MAHPTRPAIAAPGDNTGEQTHFDLNLDPDQLKIGLCLHWKSFFRHSLTHLIMFLISVVSTVLVGGGLAASNEICVMYREVVLCPLKRQKWISDTHILAQEDVPRVLY